MSLRSDHDRRKIQFKTGRAQCTRLFADYEALVHLDRGPGADEGTRLHCSTLCWRSWIALVDRSTSVGIHCIVCVAWAIMVGLQAGLRLLR